ncbi:MAG: alpha/beta hydrolase [Terriglobia bacterium]
MYAEYEDALKAITQAGIGPADPLTTPLQEARAIQNRYFAFLGSELPLIDHVEDAHIEGPVESIPLRVFYPAGTGPFPVVLFLRGAGWWAGGLDSHARTARLIAIESGFAVCAAGYHCSPEFKCPAQLNEVLCARRWLRNNAASLGLDGGNIVLWGESAGANMCLAASQALRDDREDLPCGLILFYGNFAGPSPASRPYSKWVWKQYLRDPSQAKDPRAVPLLAGMGGLPPMWLGVGDADPLLKDTLALAEKLRAAAVPHQVVVYPGLPHAFAMLNRIFAGAVEAIRDAAQSAQSFVNTAAPQRDTAATE